MMVPPVLGMYCRKLPPTTISAEGGLEAVFAHAVRQLRTIVEQAIRLR